MSIEILHGGPFQHLAIDMIALMISLALVTVARHSQSPASAHDADAARVAAEAAGAASTISEAAHP